MSASTEPFAMTPAGVAELGPRPCQVYALLDLHREHDTNVASVALTTLAHLAGCNQTAVSRALTALVDAGYVLRRPQPRPAATRYVLVYRNGSGKRIDRAAGSSMNGNDQAADSSIIKLSNELPAAHVVRELEKKDARASDDVAALRALELGELPGLDLWLVNVGSAYAHDESIFGEEIAPVWKKHAGCQLGLDVERALRDRALSAVAA
jgi:DNA-binding MarR family transcriptional regulator